MCMFCHNDEVFIGDLYFAISLILLESGHLTFAVLGKLLFKSNQVTLLYSYKIK